MKISLLLVAVIAVAGMIVGSARVYAQSASPSAYPSPSVSPSPAASAVTVPSAAPRTGYGTLAR